MGVYGGLMAIYVTFLFFSGLLLYRCSLTASTNIHNSVFAAVLGARMSFFDSTPIGRVVNRFANDMDQLDDSLPDSLDQTMFFGLGVLFLSFRSLIILN